MLIKGGESLSTFNYFAAFLQPLITLRLIEQT